MSKRSLNGATLKMHNALEQAMNDIYTQSDRLTYTVLQTSFINDGGGVSGLEKIFLIQEKNRQANGSFFLFNYGFATVQYTMENEEYHVRIFTDTANDFQSIFFGKDLK